MLEDSYSSRSWGERLSSQPQNLAGEASSVAWRRSSGRNGPSPTMCTSGSIGVSDNAVSRCCMPFRSSIRVTASTLGLVPLGVYSPT